jgi:hypothetical protein
VFLEWEYPLTDKTTFYILMKPWVPNNGSVGVGGVFKPSIIKAVLVYL